MLLVVVDVIVYDFLLFGFVDHDWCAAVCYCFDGGHVEMFVCLWCFVVVLIIVGG